MMAKLSPLPRPSSRGASIKGFPYTLSTTQGVEWVYSTTPVPDPDWKLIDKQDHRHWRTEEGDLPTLREIVETAWCEDCCDMHEYTRYVCKRCGEEITPGTKAPPMEGTPVVGRREAEVTVEGDAGESFVMLVCGDLLVFEKVSQSYYSDRPPRTFYVAVGEV